MQSSLHSTEILYLVSEEHTICIVDRGEKCSRMQSKRAKLTGISSMVSRLETFRKKHGDYTNIHLSCKEVAASVLFLFWLL